MIIAKGKYLIDYQYAEIKKASIKKDPINVLPKFQG